MHAGVDELRDLFVSLAEIPSPSREEGELGAFVHQYLERHGLAVIEDGAAAAMGCGCGNLLIRVPGRGGGTPVAFCAHLDTVPVEGRPVVVVDGGRIRTDGRTILGADDKAAVAVLLLALRDLAAEPPAADVEVLFTVGEEIGLLGARAFDLATLRARAMFVLDSEGDPGTLIVSAPGATEVDATFTGVAAHAGIDPENGRSAVVAAAHAIVGFELGRIDEETTANVGVVQGGSAINVVPDHCVIRGEARSRDAGKLARQVGRMIDACTLAATEAGVDVEIDVREEYRGYAHDAGSLPLRLAQSATAEAGLEAAAVGGGGGSDANVFNAQGLPALTLGVGFQHLHSPQESIRIDHLAQLSALVRAIVAVAGRTPA